MVKSAAYAVCVVALALVALSGPWIRSNIREAHLKRRMAAFGQRLATLQKERADLQARSKPLEAGERRNKQLRTMAPANVRLPDESGGVDAIARTLMSVFNQTDILALGESHEQQSESDLRIALVRHPGFAKTVRSIVVEFGSASRQATLDRYIRGEDVPRGQLQQVWKTTQVGGGGSPIYPAFFAAVRDVNSAGLRFTSDDQFVDVPYAYGAIVAIEAETGPVRWATTREPGVFHWPPAVNDRDVFAAGEKQLIAIR